MISINYNFLSDAIEFYKGKGYIYREVPWIVHTEAGLQTTPHNREPLEVAMNRVLVGSAEQSFLELSEELEFSKYVACTPCFRDEPFHDKYHQAWFMKVELIEWLSMNETIADQKEQWYKMVHEAAQFFSKHIPVKVIKTAELSCDIVTKENNIELGSYGIREASEFGRWIYGTGCAEPRLSTTIEELKND